MIDEGVSRLVSSPAEPEVSVVVPVYRNAETVGELSSRIASVLDGQGVSFEILFVNDACPEGSLAVLAVLADADDRVRVLSLKRNVGQQRAILAGLACAHGRKTVVMDADLQDPPEAIPLLLDRVGDGYDAVFAGRRGRYESSLRLFTSRLFKRVLRAMLDVPTDAGAFVAMSRKMKECLLLMPSQGAHVVAMIGASGLPVDSIPVERAPRPRGRSSYTAWGRLRVGGLAVGWVLWRRLARARAPLSVMTRVRGRSSGREEKVR
jgi:hypothetical protein